MKAYFQIAWKQQTSHLHIKKEPTDNENYRPVGVLPLLSKSLKNYFMINLVNT